MTPTDPAALVRRIKLAMATANEGVLLELLEAAAAALSALVGEKECILQVIRDMRDGFTDPTSGEPRVGFEQKWRVAHEILVEVRAKLAKVGQFNEVSRVYTDDSPERLGEVCAHGSLKRQCRVCELEADVARLAQENERLTERVVSLKAALRVADESIQAWTSGDVDGNPRCTGCGAQGSDCFRGCPVAKVLATITAALFEPPEVLPI